MVNSIDPDQMPHSAVFLIRCHGPLHLIWVFTVCPNLKGGKNILTELPPQKVYTFYYEQNNIFWSEGRGKVKGQSWNRMLLVNFTSWTLCNCFNCHLHYQRKALGSMAFKHFDYSSVQSWSVLIKLNIFLMDDSINLSIVTFIATV